MRPEILATEVACHLAITAYSLCVPLQRWRLLTRAAVFGGAQGKATLKFAAEVRAARDWWVRVSVKLTTLPNCHAIESLQTSTPLKSPFVESLRLRRIRACNPSDLIHEGGRMFLRRGKGRIAGGICE